MLRGIEKVFLLIVSYVIAVIRLMFWQVIFLFSGLQEIFFAKSEICGVDLKTIPLWCDREDILNNLSYIDKLSVENPDLMEEASDEINKLIEDDDDDDFGEDK